MRHLATAERTEPHERAAIYLLGHAHPDISGQWAAGGTQEVLSNCAQHIPVAGTAAALKVHTHPQY